MQHTGVGQRQHEAVPGAAGAWREVVQASPSQAVITQGNGTERPSSTTHPSNAEQQPERISGPSPPVVARPGAVPHIPAQGSCCGMGQPGPQGQPAPTSCGLEPSTETCLPLQPTLAHPPCGKPPSEQSYSNSCTLVPCFGTSFTPERHTVCIKAVTFKQKTIYTDNESLAEQKP